VLYTQLYPPSPCLTTMVERSVGLSAGVEWFKASG
jgi:hypothetical protein